MKNLVGIAIGLAITASIALASMHAEKSGSCCKPQAACCTPKQACCVNQSK